MESSGERDHQRRRGPVHAAGPARMRRARREVDWFGSARLVACCSGCWRGPRCPGTRSRSTTPQREPGGSSRRAGRRTAAASACADGDGQLPRAEDGLRTGCGPHRRPARRVRAARADPDALRARVDRYARDVRSAFDRAPEQRRAVLERLRAGCRMTVHAEAEPGFRVEGLFELGLEMTSARSPEGDRATRNGVSGGVLRPGVAAPRS